MSHATSQNGRGQPSIKPSKRVRPTPTPPSGRVILKAPLTRASRNMSHTRKGQRQSASRSQTSHNQLEL
jgi:hypothetical protein